MKRSSAVQLTLVLSVAAALSSCNRGSNAMMRRCVDGSDVVVDDRYCRDAPATGYRSGAAGMGYYHWYYGGRRGFVPMGTRMSGGSYDAPAGSRSVSSSSSSTSSGTSRGVVGSSGRAAGSSSS